MQTVTTRLPIKVDRSNATGMGSHFLVVVRSRRGFAMVRGNTEETEGLFTLEGGFICTEAADTIEI